MDRLSTSINDQDVANLEKANYDLKLRNFKLERSIAENFPDDIREVIAENVSLNNTLEAAKSELEERNILLVRARNTIQNLQADIQLATAAKQSEEERAKNASNAAKMRQQQLRETQDKLEEFDRQLNMSSRESKQRIETLERQFELKEKEYERKIRDEFVPKSTFEEISRRLREKDHVGVLLEEKTKEVYNLNRGYEKSSSENLRLSNQINEVERLAASLKDRNEVLVKNLQEKDQLNASLQEELDSTRKEMTSSKTELSKNLITKIKQALKKAEEETMHASALGEKVKVLESSISMKDRELGALRSKLNEGNQLKLELMQTQQSLAEVKLLEQSKDRKCIQLKNQLQMTVTQQEYDDLQNDLNTKEKKLKQIRMALRQKEAELADYERDMVPRRALEDSKMRILDLEKSMHMTMNQSRYNNMSMDTSTLHDTNTTNMMSPRGNRTTMMHDTFRVDNLRSEIRTLNMQNKTLQQSLKDAKDKIIQLSFQQVDADELDSLQQQNKKKDKLIRQLKETISQKDEEIASRVGMLDQREVRRMMDKRTNLQSFESNLSFREEDMNRKTMILSEQLNLSTRLLEEKVREGVDSDLRAQEISVLLQKVSSDAQNSHQQVRDLQQKILTMVPKDENISLLRELEDTRQSKDSKQKQLQAKIHSLERRLQDETINAEQMEKNALELTSKVREIRNKEQQIDYLEGEMSSLRNEIEGHIHDKNILENHYAETSERLNSLVQQHNSLSLDHQDNLDKMSNINNALNQCREFNQLPGDLNNDEMIRHVGSLLQKTVMKLKNKEETIMSMEKEIARFEEQIAAMRKQTQQELAAKDAENVVKLARISQELEDDRARFRQTEQMLMQEKNENQIRLEAYENKIRDLQMKFENEVVIAKRALEDKASDFERKFAMTNDQLLHQQSENQTLSSQVIALRARNEELNKMIERLRNEMESNVQKERKLNEKIGTLGTMNTTVETRLEMTLKQMDELKAKIASLSNELEAAYLQEKRTASLNEANYERAKELETRLSMMQGDNEVMKKEISSKNIELDSWKEKNRQLQGTEARLKGKFDEISALEAQREAKLRIAQESRKQIELEFSSENQKRQRAENEAKDLRHQMQTQESKLERLRIVEEERERLNREINSLKNRMDSSVQSLQGELKLQQQTLEDKLHSERDRSVKLTAELERIQAKSWQMEQNSVRLEREHSRLTDELKNKEDQIRQEQLKRERVQQTNIENETKLDRLKQEGQMLENKLQLTEARQKELEKRNEELQNEKTNLTSEQWKLQNEIQNQKQDVERKLQELKNEQEKAAELERARERLNDEAKSAAERAEENAKKMSNLEKELKMTMNDKQNTENAMDRLKNSTLSKSDILKRMVDIFQSLDLASEDQYGNYSKELDVDLPPEFWDLGEDTTSEIWDIVLKWLQGKVNAFKRIKRAFDTTVAQCEDKWTVQYEKLEDELAVREDEVLVLQDRLDSIVFSQQQQQQQNQPRQQQRRNEMKNDSRSVSRLAPSSAAGGLAGRSNNRDMPSVDSISVRPVSSPRPLSSQSRLSDSFSRANDRLNSPKR